MSGERREHDAERVGSEISWNVKDAWHRTQDEMHHLKQQMHHSHDNPAGQRSGLEHSKSIASNVEPASEHRQARHAAAKATSPEEYEAMKHGAAYHEELKKNKGYEQGGYYSSKYGPGFDKDVKRVQSGEDNFRWM